MRSEKKFYIVGFILCVIAAVYLVYACSHPELTFPWSNWVTYTIYGIYIIYTILIFCMPRMKDADLVTCIILAAEFLGLACVVISIGLRKEAGVSNWFLPTGLFLTCFGNFANALVKKRSDKK